MRRAVRRLAEGIPCTEDCLLAGLPLLVWWDAWLHCHECVDGQWRRTAWPDGGAYVDQPDPLVVIFGWMRSEMQRATNARLASER